jgi:photosystem II stability/assembly factor-like uncharacterized protein
VNLPVNNTSLFRISFSDSLHGCITGSDGTFLYTEDNGTSWQVRAIPAAYTIRECKLVSQDVAWAFATNNDYTGLQRSILRSTNKGVTWVVANPSDTLRIFSAQFISPTTAFATSGSSFWATIDGITWEPRGEISGNIVYYGLEFFDQNNGYKGGGCGMVAYGRSQQTTDGGRTWTVTCRFSPPALEIETYFPDHFIDGRLGTMHWSTGGELGTLSRIGLTWNAGMSYVWFDELQTSYRFGFALDPLDVWLLSTPGQIRRTTNGGATWKEDTLAVPITEILNDTYHHRFALGNGRLFRFDPNATGIEESPAQPSQFVLLQNFPNPFNPETRIKFTVSSYEFVSLKVFDVLGRELATLVNEEMKPGRYERTFDASGLASGVYFYRLLTGSFVETRKMILLR